MKTSKLFSLDLSDLGKGLVVAIITAILTSLITMINENGLMFSAGDFTLILQTAISAGIAYLLKNFSTNSDNQLGKAEVIR